MWLEICLYLSYGDKSAIFLTSSTLRTHSNQSIGSLIEKLKSHFMELPVVSFNEQTYDLIVMWILLIRHLMRQDKIQFKIKCNNCMKAIKNQKPQIPGHFKLQLEVSRTVSRNMQLLGL